MGSGRPDAPDRMGWWTKARFGMFVHWGLYSIPGRGEWLMYQEHIPVEEYRQLADKFTAEEYDPAEWVAVAKDAGMKYMVITTRHHDGFCLFDSEASEFNATRSAAGRDLIAEFVEACRDADMRIGFYYSLVDWRFPGVLPHHPRKPDSVYVPMVRQAHAQVRELCTNYGPIDILWYDMMIPHDPALWHSRELSAMARRLQPGIIINDRAGIPEDFSTPENAVTPQPGPWESCFSMNRTWGYATYDRNYKSVREIIRILASCTSENGNLLLNVAPEGSGRLPSEGVERLRRVGQWIRVNGKAIYGAGRSPVGAPALGVASRVGNTVYLLIQRWPGSTVPFAWCGSKVMSARLLSSGQEADIEQRGDRVWLRGLPRYPPDPYLSVMELEFDGEPHPSDPPYA